MKKIANAVQEWLSFASEDLLAAEVLLRENIYNQACFHAQQCAEKLLKAALLRDGQHAPKLHDLNELFERCIQANVLALLPYREKIATLSLYYVPTRYPDAIVGTLPDRLPNRNDAKEAADFARGLMQLILKICV